MAKGTPADSGFFVFLNLFRWINWVLAVVLLLTGSTPAVSAELTAIVYLSALFYTSAFTIWPTHIERLLRARPALMAVDVAFCTALLLAYGWRSPFFVYSFSPVMLGGYLYRLRGGFIVAALSAAGYGAAVGLTGHTFAEINELGYVDSHLFHYFDYFLIAVFFSYPAVISEKLRQAVAELQTASAQIADLTREQERRRLAEDIHDSAIQNLYGLKLMIEAMFEHSRGNPKLGQKLLLAQETAGRALSDLRQSIDDLFDERFIQRALSEAIAEALEEAGRRHDFEVNLTTGGADRTMGREGKKAAFLILSEALNNIIKHAGASKVEVEIHHASDFTRIEISDDGRGFNDDAKGSGRGLQSMAKRAAELGGRCDVVSGAGRGTKVVATIPVSSAQLV